MGLLSWLNPLEIITGKLADAYKAKQDAKTDQAKLEADLQIRNMEVKRDVVIAAMGEPWWTPRSLMGYSVTVLVVKLVVWDSAFGLGVTPPVGEFVTWISATIIGFYFISRSAETITQTIANAMKGRK